MTVNEGMADRVLRVIVGIAVLSLFFLLEGNGRYWGLAGVVPLLTGLIGYCPLYSLLGFNTCPVGSNKQ